MKVSVLFLAAFISLGASKSNAIAPPASVLHCVGLLAKHCPKKHLDYLCLCNERIAFLTCLAIESPYGNFLEARDHYLGTCIERLPFLENDPSYNVELGGYENGIPPEKPIDGNDGDKLVGKRAKDPKCDSAPSTVDGEINGTDDGDDEDEGTDINCRDDEDEDEDERHIDCGDDHEDDNTENSQVDWCDDDNYECLEDDEQDIQDYLSYKRRFLSMQKGNNENWQTRSDDDIFWEAERDSREAILHEYGSDLEAHYNNIINKEDIVEQLFPKEELILEDVYFNSSSNSVEGTNMEILEKQNSELHNTFEFKFADPSKVFGIDVPIPEVADRSFKVEKSPEGIVFEDEAVNESSELPSFDPSSLSEGFETIPFEGKEGESEGLNKVSDSPSKRKRVKKKFAKHTGVK